MNADIPNREYTLPFAIETVKAAIAHTAEVHRTSKILYSSTDSNELLGMYKYTSLLGELSLALSNGTIWLNLQELTEQKTKVVVSGVASGNYANAAYALAQNQDYILKLITQELQGTFDSQAELQRNSGCLGVVLIIIISTIAAYFIS